MTSTEPRETDFTISRDGSVFIFGFESSDETNRLNISTVGFLADEIENVATPGLPILPLIITGNHRFFSVGADLNEIAQLTGASASEFAKMGQRLMNAIANYPALTIAAINGYCMGGGLDLALACEFRIASPNSIFGHRGA